MPTQCELGLGKFEEITGETGLKVLETLAKSPSPKARRTASVTD